MTAPDTDTLAAYCLAHGLDMHSAGETELARVWTKVEAIRAKHAAKPKGSALPVVGLDALLMDLHDLASDAYDNGKEHESGTMIRAYDTITDLEARLAAAVEVQDRLMSERYQHYLRAEAAEAGEDALAEALQCWVEEEEGKGRSGTITVYNTLAAYEARRKG